MITKDKLVIFYSTFMVTFNLMLDASFQSSSYFFNNSLTVSRFPAFFRHLRTVYVFLSSSSISVSSSLSLSICLLRSSLPLLDFVSSRNPPPSRLFISLFRLHVHCAYSLWVDSTNYEIFTTIKRFKQL